MEEEAKVEEKKPTKADKKRAKKEAKKAAKEAKRLAREKQEREARIAKQKALEENDPLKPNYGTMVMVQSQSISDKKWTSLKEINRDQEKFVGKEVLVRARIHTKKK